MANVDSSKQQQAALDMLYRFDTTFIQIQNLVCAIDRLASQHIDATTDEVDSDARYYAQSLHQNAAAIVGVAGCIEDILGSPLWLTVRKACVTPQNLSSESEGASHE